MPKTLKTGGASLFYKHCVSNMEHVYAQMEPYSRKQCFLDLAGPGCFFLVYIWFRFSVHHHHTRFFMLRKKKKTNIKKKCCFDSGTYLVGLFILFWSSNSNPSMPVYISDLLNQITQRVTQSCSRGKGAVWQKVSVLRAVLWEQRHRKLLQAHLNKYQSLCG